MTVTPPLAPVTIEGREMLVTKFDETQIMLMNSLAVRIQRPDLDVNRKLSIADRLYKVIYGAFVTEGDQDFVEDLLAEKKLDLKGLMTMLTEATMTGEPTPKPKVRRARATAK